ncbi:unnamed protein product, partial [Tetraodon nigroviridis]
SLLTSLKYACEILTEDEEGGAARIPFVIFAKLYTYLAHLDGDIPQRDMDKFLSGLRERVPCMSHLMDPVRHHVCLWDPTGDLSETVPCPGPASPAALHPEDGATDSGDLDDCRSILSDDSFYPPDDAFADSERSPSPQSPEPLSFFRACCANNAAVVRLMIRRGVTLEEVTETDQNNRVGGTHS